MITIDSVKQISQKISLENICALCNLSLAQVEEEETILYQNEEEGYISRFT
ncbi:MAG: hypothetical protein HFH83_00930 [Lachnospiraceae bacterium]|jgi:hypothetical protein|nr:hypothetical protein [Lachnospiraceae bacterium]